MVKHGRNKKRRAGRIGKTKLKNRTYQRWNPSPRFGDKTVGKLWDVTKSPSVNLANMGLLARPNQDVHRVNNNADAGGEGSTSIIELYDIPDSDAMGPKKQHPMPKDDQEYIARCMAKHGDDYARIFRDIKVNNMQHTETKLRKMGARFLLLSAEQRVVDLPAKVKDLAQESS